MAETTTRPNRTRKPAEKAAEKAPKAATPPKAKAAPGVKAPTIQVGDDGRTRVPVQLELVAETKTYMKFVPPESSGCVGNFYAPLGTEEVKVLLIGPTA